MTTYLKLKSLYSTKSTTVLLLAAIIISSFLLAPLITRAATNIPLCEITRGLRVGSSGEDVRCLQRYLNYAGYTIASSGAGSPGSESTYFGALTAAAVTRWQNDNATYVLLPVGLTTGTGYFGTLSFDRYVAIVKTQLALP